MDLLVNPEDGLGAWRHYESQFARVQSEFIHLPFPDLSVSSVIFNASFHYSENYEQTLAEALRVLQTAGQIIIIDSPVYAQLFLWRTNACRKKGKFYFSLWMPHSIKSEGYLTSKE